MSKRPWAFFKKLELHDIRIVRDLYTNLIQGRLSTGEEYIRQRGKKKVED